MKKRLLFIFLTKYITIKAKQWLCSLHVKLHITGNFKLSNFTSLPFLKFENILEKSIQLQSLTIKCFLSWLRSVFFKQLVMLTCQKVGPFKLHIWPKQRACYSGYILLLTVLQISEVGSRHMVFTLPNAISLRTPVKNILKNSGDDTVHIILTNIQLLAHRKRILKETYTNSRQLRERKWMNKCRSLNPHNQCARERCKSK